MANRSRLGRWLIWLLPVVVCVLWFLAEQLPGWLMPQPPWVRYPELLVLPGGCEAANQLRLIGALRDQAQADSESAETIRQQMTDALAVQLPESAYRFVLPPEALQGANPWAWWALVAFEPPSTLANGAILLSTAEGQDIQITPFVGAGSEATEGSCGAFSPRPAGLRALLRPYLPLFAAGGYLFLSTIIWAATRWRRSRALT